MQVSENKSLVKELSTLQRKLEQVNKEKDTSMYSFGVPCGLLRNVPQTNVCLIILKCFKRQGKLELFFGTHGRLV